jgi:hypothetical protein
MATTITGSGVDNIVDGTITNADINASAAIAGSKVDGSFGKVLQVVQVSGAVSRTTISSTGSWTSHFSLAITPSATSSKILISVVTPICLQGTGGMSRGGLRLQRGSTTVWNNDDFGEQFQFRNADNEGNQVIPIVYLDSPSTTSATTYTVQGTLMTGNALLMFEKDKGTNMVLMEIEG